MKTKTIEVLCFILILSTDDPAVLIEKLGQIISENFKHVNDYQKRMKYSKT